MNKAIFLDMDGTIARFYENRATCLEAMYDRDFFKYLNPYMSMLYAIKQLIAEGIKVYPCSACVTEYCKEEKKEWLKAVLSEIPEEDYILLNVGENKAEVVKKVLGCEDLSNAFLIDDYSKNLHEWRNGGGNAIKFMNELNGTNGTWDGPRVSWDNDANTIASSIKQYMSC